MDFHAHENSIIHSTHRIPSYGRWTRLGESAKLLQAQLSLPALLQILPSLLAQTPFELLTGFELTVPLPWDQLSMRRICRLLSELFVPNHHQEGNERSDEKCYCIHAWFAYFIAIHKLKIAPSSSSSPNQNGAHGGRNR